AGAAEIELVRRLETRGEGDTARLEVGDGTAQPLACNGAETVELTAQTMTVDLLIDAAEGERGRHHILPLQCRGLVLIAVPTVRAVVVERVAAKKLVRIHAGVRRLVHAEGARNERIDAFRRRTAGEDRLAGWVKHRAILELGITGGTRQPEF